MFWKKIISFFIVQKIHIRRAQEYVSIFNSGMILFLVVSKLGLKASMFFILWFFGIIVMAFIGYLDFKLGILKEEKAILGQANRYPFWNKLFKILAEIQKEIKK